MFHYSDAIGINKIFQGRRQKNLRKKLRRGGGPKKIPIFNLGIFKPQKCLNSKPPHPKKKNKTLNFALLPVNICLNVHFKMSV